MYKQQNLLIKFFLRLSLFSVLFCSSASSYANVLSGSHVLDLSIKKAGKVNFLTAFQDVKVYDKKIEKGFAVFKEKAMYLFPDKFRSEVKIQNKLQIFVSDYEKTLKIFDNKIETEYETGFDHYKDILLFRNKILLEQRLNLIGIDTSASNLKRYFGGIAFVLGKQKKYGENFPQLWIDKENFLPARCLLRRQSADKSKPGLEIRYTNWKRKGKIRYPFHIEFFKNKNLIREIIVKRLDTENVLDEKLFDISQLKKKFQAQDTDNTKVTDDTDKQIESLDDIIQKDQLAF